MQQKQGVIVSQVGGDGLNAAFEETKMALDFLVARCGHLDKSSRVAANETLERGLSPHGRRFSFKNDDGVQTIWFMFPATITLK